MLTSECYWGSADRTTVTTTDTRLGTAELFPAPKDNTSGGKQARRARQESLPATLLVSFLNDPRTWWRGHKTRCFCLSHTTNLLVLMRLGEAGRMPRPVIAFICLSCLASLRGAHGEAAGERPSVQVHATRALNWDSNYRPHAGECSRSKPCTFTVTPDPTLDGTVIDLVAYR
eukprot:scaffold2691_cov417-Prasinococcus_capsulatus_cf.AAC.27